MITITMHATYDTVEWDDDDPCMEPTTGGGFTDPSNPYGGWKTELPAHENRDPSWYAENVERVTFTNLAEAAEFAAEFPGAVWDWHNEASPDMDYRTGVETTVCLHIEGPWAPAVITIAKALDAGRSRAIAAHRASLCSAW